MKKTTLLKFATVIAALAMAYGVGWAQAPTSVSAESSTLVKDSTNSALAYTSAEYIDSLTVGAANVKYLVYPDLNISPSYNFATSATANLNSTFAWSTSPSAGVTINNAVAGFATNYAKITFPSSTGDYTISVIETTTASTCAGTAKTLAARLIAVPTVTGGSAAAVSCPSSDMPYNMNVPSITLSGLTTAVANNGFQQIQITYTLTGPTDAIGTSGTIGSGTISLAEGSAIPDLSALNGLIDFPGTYTFSITAISDRISRKSAVAVTPSFTDVTFVVNRRPVTGPIYHVPNM